MNADFLDAHHRHWQDAEQLFQSKRWANSDHLFGMAAECGLKCLMLAFGMPFDTVKDRPANEADRKHADGIWARFESYRSGHAQGAGYMLLADPFADWHVAQRYAHQSKFDQARANGHRVGADVVNQLVRQAQREGLI